MNQDILKQRAAHYAVDHYIKSGMIVGLGSGSTALYGVRRLSARINAGKLHDILGIPASETIRAEAERLSISLTTLDTHPTIDVTFDGADEVDPQMNLIKGGGGALLREKIIAMASRQEIIVVDADKLVPQLGTGWAVPVEVVSFGLGAHRAFLESLGGRLELRTTEEGVPYQTDNGNLILDAHLGPIGDPYRLAEKLNAQAGIVEHGLFLDLATRIVVAGEDGIRIIEA